MGWLECGQPSGPAARHKAKLTMPTTGDRVAASSLDSKIPEEVFFSFGIWKLFLFLLCFCFVLFSLFFLIMSVVMPVDETRPGEHVQVLPASFSISLAFLLSSLGTMPSVACSPKTRTSKDPVLPHFLPHHELPIMWPIFPGTFTLLGLPSVSAVFLQPIKPQNLFIEHKSHISFISPHLSSEPQTYIPNSFIQPDG